MAAVIALCNPRHIAQGLQRNGDVKVDTFELALLMNIMHGVGNFMHYLSRFIAGFMIGFLRVWQISLVTLSIVPLIAIAGGVYAYVATGLIARVRKSYVNAGEIAEEAASMIHPTSIDVPISNGSGSILEYDRSMTVRISLH
ncbi:ABC transporter transmembrane region [Asimina triloba]